MELKKLMEHISIIPVRTQTDAAGRTTEYSPDVVTGLITRFLISGREV